MTTLLMHAVQGFGLDVIEWAMIMVKDADRLCRKTECMYDVGPRFELIRTDSMRKRRMNEEYERYGHALDSVNCKIALVSWYSTTVRCASAEEERDQACQLKRSAEPSLAFVKGSIKYLDQSSSSTPRILTIYARIHSTTPTTPIIFR